MFIVQNTEASVSKAPPLKSPWAAIVKSEPKQKESVVPKTAAKPQVTKQGSNASAANGKQDSQVALPSYAQNGVSHRQSTSSPVDSKKSAQADSTSIQSPEARFVDVDRHAPATPAASTSPVPPSDTPSSTSEKFREEGNAAEASTSRAAEAEVSACSLQATVKHSAAAHNSQEAYCLFGSHILLFSGTDRGPQACQDGLE